MEYKALYGEFPFLKEVGRERQEQFAVEKLKADGAFFVTNISIKQIA